MVEHKMRVGGVPEHFNAPWHIASGKGCFKAHNVDVQWTEYPGGTGDVGVVVVVLFSGV